MSPIETGNGSNRDDAAALWPALLSLGAAGGEAIASARPETLRTAAVVLSPALVDATCRAVGGIPEALNSLQVQQSRLFNRFVRTDGLRWARLAEAEGIPVLAIKGLATAHALYPDPDARPMSDSDLLVRQADLAPLLRVFAAAGLAFRPVAAASRWGFVSDASFQALTSTDEAANIDLHVHPDAWPLHRVLTTDAVFAEGRLRRLGDGSLRLPCPLHMLLIGISHAARDRFQVETAKSFVDAALLLRAHGTELDWARFEIMCRGARMLGPARAFFALLGDLGGDVSAVPAALRRQPRTAEFRRALLALTRFDTTSLGSMARLRREALLSSAPSVFLYRMALRAKGLLQPNPGLPS